MSLVPDSTLGAREIRPDPSAPHMGTVRPSAGKKSFRIRVACEHWAPNKASDDCRYGCEAKAQIGAFVP